MTEPERRWVEPVVLEGRIVRLEPLSRDHLDGLAEVALDPAIWQWTRARPTDRATLGEWLDAAVAWPDTGHTIGSIGSRARCGASRLPTS